MAVALLLISGCCKSNKCKCEERYGERVDDCQPKHFGPYFLGEVKDYLYFKKGSYWIYRNSLSQEMDSIYTVYCDTPVIFSTGEFYKWQTMTYTDIGFRLQSDIFNAAYTFSMGKHSPDALEYSYNIRLNRNTSFYYTELNTAFTYPFVKDNSNLFQQMVPAMNILGKTYTDVAVFQNWIDHTVQRPTLSFYFITSAPTKYYWAKGFGLVLIEQNLYRYDTQQNFIQKWELVRCQLVK